MTTEEKEISPGSYVDFLHYLDTVTTEEALFSRLTYWFAFQTSPDDVHSRIDLVEQRARELRLWNGLDLKVERWMQACKEEFNTMDREAFTAFVTQDYTAYRDGAAGQKGGKPELKATTAAELSEMLIPPIRYIVDELVPMGLGVLVAKPKIGKSWMILDLVPVGGRRQTVPELPHTPARHTVPCIGRWAGPHEAPH